MIPTDVRLRRKSKIVELVYADETICLPCEYLRVYSPSAEVQGHGPGQEVLQTHKEDVNIVAIEPVGHYALRIIYSDSHDSGLYTWDLLRDLAINRKQRWDHYLARLSKAAIKRQVQDHDRWLS